MRSSRLLTAPQRGPFLARTSVRAGKRTHQRAPSEGVPAGGQKNPLGLHSRRPYPDRGDGCRLLKLVVNYHVNYHANYHAKGECNGCGVAVNPGRAVHRQPD